MDIERLERLVPQWLRDALPAGVKRRLAGTMASPARSLPSVPALRLMMARYRTDRLAGISPGEFEATIRGFLAQAIARSEKYEEPGAQRAQSMRFVWGHDHDFGSFSVAGAMADRHLTLLATFIDRLDGIPLDLSGRKVLDIGCWTGGTSLLLAAMGADVVAVEEVGMYVESLGYLRRAFDVGNLGPRHASLYDCRGPDFEGRFDVVLFAGVLYHVTDPVLALRITFNCLVDGGVCLLETASIRSRRAVLDYRGPTRIDGTNAGWNWFVPSPPSLRRMLHDVGFDEVRLIAAPGSRTFAVARRTGGRDMLRAGLSARGVR